MGRFTELEVGRSRGARRGVFSSVRAARFESGR